MERKRIAAKIRNESEINKGNRIILVHNDNSEEFVKSLKNISIKYYGENSLIKIYDNYNITQLNLFVGEGSYLEFGRNLRLRFPFTVDAKVKNTTIVIGDNACIGTGNIFAGDEEGLEVIIGDHFLSATDLYIRNSDGHTIYDIETKQPINKPEFGIHIGNNVWCGYNVSIIKDTNIPDNCVIGAGSVVGKKEFCKNSIIAGVPAKTVRKGIMWDERSVTKYLGLDKETEFNVANESFYSLDEYFNDNFFVISSNDELDNIIPRMYGYVITENNVLINSHNCNYKFPELSYGCYVNVTSNDNFIRIYQDYFGSYGLYLYKTEDYFAISNSFMLLANYLSKNKALSFNDDFAKAYLGPQTSVLTYRDTLINEIDGLPKNCSVQIDKVKKTAEVCYYKQKETYIPIDSKEGVDVIDRWHCRWNKIIRCLIQSNQFVECDLSGGKGSRAILSILFPENLDMDRIRFFSANDKLATHSDDFAIASQISKRYNFKLYDTDDKEDKFKMDPQDNLKICMFAKCGFNKELMFHPNYYSKVVFRVNDAGGDLRNLWNEPPQEFIDENCDKIKYNSVDCKGAFRKMLEKTAEQVGTVLEGHEHTANDLFYRMGRQRFHNGKAAAENFMSNMIWVAPLFDPELYLLNQNIGRDNDHDLLYAIIYDRYIPEINDIAFDSNRVVSEETWAVAHEINQNYPYTPSEDNEKNTNSDKTDFIIENTRVAPKKAVLDQKVEDLLKNQFYSEEVKDFICSYFGEEVYNTADRYYRDRAYHPYIYASCLVQMYTIYKAVADSRTANNLPAPELPSMSKNSFSIPVLYSNNGFMREIFDFLNSGRFDIKNIGGKDNDVHIVSKSDNDLFTEVPKWWTNDQGKGYVHQSTKGKLKIRLHCIGSGKLIIKLLGPYAKDDSGNVMSIKTDYTHMLLTNDQTGEAVFSNDNATYTTDSSHPKIIETECTDGQFFTLELNWSPYIYALSELQHIFEKLYCKHIKFFKFWKPND